MELVISIAFGLWFLIGAIFYGFITRPEKNNKKRKGSK